MWEAGEVHLQPPLLPPLPPPPPHPITISAPSSPTSLASPPWPGLPPALVTTVRLVSAVVVVNSPPTTAPTSHCQIPSSFCSTPWIRRAQESGDAGELILPSSQARPPPME